MSIFLAIIILLSPFNPYKPIASDYAERYDDPITGDYLDYWVHTPDIQTDTLIVFLHGDGEVGKMRVLENYGIVSYVKEIYGSSFPFILLVPCTSQYSWVKGTIPDTLMDLIRYVKDEYRCTNVVITGQSRGSIGTWYMAAAYPDEFVCAVPVSCPAEESDPTEIKCPVWAHQGSDDFSSKRDIDRMIEAGLNAQLTVWRGKNHATTQRSAYNKETFDWMLQWCVHEEPVPAWKCDLANPYL